VLKEVLKPAPKQPKKSVPPPAGSEGGVPVRKAERVPREGLGNP
jgi:hypothetical protein